MNLAAKLVKSGLIKYLSRFNNQKLHVSGFNAIYVLN